LSFKVENNMERNPMILTTIDSVPGYYLTEYLGLVEGVSVWSEGTADNIQSHMEHTRKGEDPILIVSIKNAMGKAKGRMVKEAEELGADAIIGIRPFTTEMISTAAELIYMGTAVKLKKDELGVAGSIEEAEKYS